MAKHIFFVIIVIPDFTPFSPAAQYTGRHTGVLLIEMSLRAEITVIGSVRRPINFFLLEEYISITGAAKRELELTAAAA